MKLMTLLNYLFRKFLVHMWAIPLVVVLSVVLVGCNGKTEKTRLQYMPHMTNTPILKAQRGYEGNGNGTSLLEPPEGTVPRGYTPYHCQDTSAEEAETKMQNPLVFNRANVQRGKQVFNTYCYVCHGYQGNSDGPVVPPYPIPKSLHSEDMRRWKDGHLFHVITCGQGIMRSYRSQISAEDRWAVIHYVRVLQRSQNPTDADVRAFEEAKAE